MVFRVPLLFPNAVVISRLSTQLTRDNDPDGAGPLVGGYDPDFNEPYAYEDTETSPQTGEELRTDTRIYLPQIRIPCQVETTDFEEVRQTFGGDAPVTDMTFVLHNKDLRQMGLLDESEECACVPKLKTNDRIDRVERRGSRKVTQRFKESLYIYEIKPGSWGMGPSGQDLQIVFTSSRPSTSTG
jgi:hypothetical protein